MFHSIFTLGMDDHCALLGLLFRMAAYFYQGIDHPFKSVDIIVPHNKAAGLLMLRKDVHILVFFRPRITVNKRLHICILFAKIILECSENNNSASKFKKKAGSNKKFCLDIGLS